MPVVLADGKVVAEGKIDRGSLQGLLG